MSSLLERFDPIQPTAEDRRLAMESARHLATVLRSHGDRLRVQILPDAGPGEELVLPSSVIRLLSDMLTQMAQGNAVTLIPIHAELTTQQAADFLNVSRPYLIGLLKKKELPHRMVGSHRRILFQDLVKYRQKSDSERLEALDELAELGQQIGEGY